MQSNSNAIAKSTKGPNSLLRHKSTAANLRAIEKMKLPEPEKNRLRLVATFAGVHRDGVADDPNNPTPPKPAATPEKDVRAMIQVQDINEEIDIALANARGIADMLAACSDMQAPEQHCAWAISNIIKDVEKWLDQAYLLTRPYLPRYTAQEKAAIEEKDSEGASNG